MSAFIPGLVHEQNGDFNGQSLKPNERFYNRRDSWTKHEILTNKLTNQTWDFNEQTHKPNMRF